MNFLIAIILVLSATAEAGTRTVIAPVSLGNAVDADGFVTCGDGHSQGVGQKARGDGCVDTTREPGFLTPFKETVISFKDFLQKHKPGVIFVGIQYNPYAHQAYIYYNLPKKTGK